MSRLSDYDYHLPENRIAQEPLEDRAAARLLWLHRESGIAEHRTFRDALNILSEGDLLVLNNTRVTALRLQGKKPTGGDCELLLLKRLEDSLFNVLAKPGKRLQPGSRIQFPNGLEAQVEANEEHGLKRVRFSGSNDLSALIKAAGTVPLPPYIHVPLLDGERYQTVYAAVPGSAAAPTAGLHFTEEVLSQLRARGVQTAFVSLDVSVDTFRPVKSESLDVHKMHGEACSIPKETAKAIAECRGRIIAVGTTTVRTLESFALGRRHVASGSKTTDIFIREGFEFQVIDGMFTNFHMPKTTMLLMLSALAGREKVMQAYAQALDQGYRFLSFGDSMLIL